VTGNHGPLARLTALACRRSFHLISTVETVSVPGPIVGAGLPGLTIASRVRS
jgi:hypothetical protein